MPTLWGPGDGPPLPPPSPLFPTWPEWARLTLALVLANVVVAAAVFAVLWCWVLLLPAAGAAGVVLEMLNHE